MVGRVLQILIQVRLLHTLAVVVVVVLQVVQIPQAVQVAVEQVKQEPLLAMQEPQILAEVEVEAV